MHALSLSLLILSSLPTPAFATPRLLPAGGQEFLVESLGRSRWASPKQIRLQAAAAGDRSLGCDEISASLERLQPFAQYCADNAASSACSAGRLRVRVMAEGRTKEDGSPIDRTKVRQWKVQLAPVSLNEDEVKKTVARAEGVDPSLVTVVSAPAIDDFGSPGFTVASDALTSRASSILPIEVAATVSWNNGQMLTQNAIVACDIQSGKIKLRGKARSEATYVEKAPEEVVDTAWVAYSALANSLGDRKIEGSPTQRAFALGFYLGREAPALFRAKDPLLDPTALYARFFDEDHASIRLKDYTSRGGFRATAFPDQIFTVKFNHDWSL